MQGELGGLEVKAVVAVVARVCLFFFFFSLLHSEGEEEEKLAGGPAVAPHTNTGGKHKAYLFNSPILLPQGEWKELHETAIRYGPFPASSGKPSIPQNSQGNGLTRDEWNAVCVRKSLTIIQ